MTRLSRVTTSGSPSDDDGAVVENQEAVDQADHGLHRVFDDGDRYAVAGKLLNHGDDLVGLVMSEARQGFVKQQDARLSGQRAANSISRSSLVVSSPATRSAISDRPTWAIASAANCRASVSVLART